MHVGARSGNHRSHGVVRKTADVAVKELAAAEDAAKAETETPPPPPPFTPAKKVGVTASLFFFDPLGFSKAGDKEGFRNPCGNDGSRWPSHPRLRAIPKIPKSPDRRWCRDIRQWHHRFCTSVSDFRCS